MNKERVIFSTIIIVLLVAIVMMFQKIQSDKSNYTSVHNFLQGELEVTRNKLGQQTAVNSTLELDNKKLFGQIENLKGAKKELQELVDNKLTEHATVVHTHTVLIDTVETIITLDSDSFPIYSAYYADDWITLNTKATKDSTAFDLLVKDNLQLTWEREKGFGPRPLLVKAFNQNPHTSTTELESYITKIPSRKFALGPSVGIGINSEFKPQATIGLAVTYSLISW